MSIAQQLDSTFQRLYQRRPVASFFAPGRVNLIGEHTDFNGGHVFPAAISLGTYAVAAPRVDARFRLHSLNFAGQNAGDSVPDGGGIVESDDVNAAPLAYDRKRYDWANYPLGVIATLLKKGHVIPHGLDIVFCGNLPTGAGLSSSASIEVLTAVMANEFFNLNLDHKTIALIAQEAENTFVGVQCGIMDQFAVAFGKKDHAILLNCNTLQHRYAPISQSKYRVLIANTNKRRGLDESKYNERRAECEAALAIIREFLPVNTLGELSNADFDSVVARVSAPVAQSLPMLRARHVVRENQRTLSAVDALQRGDLAAFGVLMDASHLSLRDDFAVSCRELDVLVELIRQQPGTLGARMTGAGFGGCVVALVPAASLDALHSAVAPAYTHTFGYPPDFYDIDIVNGAGRIG